jgi:hypothetical protein
MSASRASHLLTVRTPTPRWTAKARTLSRSPSRSSPASQQVHGYQTASRTTRQEGPVKGEFGIDRMADAVGTTQSVALAGESEVGDGDTALAQCLDDRLSLLGQDDAIVETVDDQDGLGDLSGVVDG